MQISNEVHLQKLALGKSFSKAFDELFSNYLKDARAAENNIQTQGKTSNRSVQEPKSAKQEYESFQEVVDKFRKDQKKLSDVYERENYKLDIQEAPSMQTMISAKNYHQKLLFDDMNEKVEAEYKKLNEKIASGKYNYFEEIELRREFDEFEEGLKKSVSDKMREFSSQYQKALVQQNFSKINDLQNSLLSNLLLQS